MKAHPQLSYDDLGLDTLIYPTVQNILQQAFISDSLEAPLEQALQSIGEFIQSSRSYIFEVCPPDHNGSLAVRKTHYWQSQAIPEDNSHSYCVDIFGLGIDHWQERLSKGEIIYDHLGHNDDATIGGAATIVAPIFVDNKWHGFIGFDDFKSTNHWDVNTLNAISFLAKVIGSALGFIEMKKAKQLASDNAEHIQKKINDALEAAEHGVWSWDLTTDKVYYSQILQKQLGYDGNEFSDALSEWRDRVHPDDLEHAIEHVQNHLAGKTPTYRCEFRMRKKDGSYAWMLAIARAVYDDNGNPIRLSGTHTDLTPQKKLEAELLKQQNILTSLINGIPDLVWLKDTDGTYLAANHRFEDFFGHPAEAIIGKTDYDFIEPGLADFFRRNDKIAIEKGSPSINEETITFANDGHQEILETIKTPIIQQNGELLGVLGVGRDITERKKVQNAQNLAASVFSNAHEGIMICDKDANIINVNPVFEEISGYSADEVIGKNPRLLSSGKHDVKFYQTLWHQLHTEGFWKGEIWNRNKAGEQYAVLCNISVTYDNDGNISNYLSVFTDISYLKEHQKELENMAHYDALTKLPNRVLLADRLQQAIKRSDRNNSLLAVCFIDLDNFKPVNDNHGHNAGDELLIQLSQRLQNKLRKQDTLARIGGDEFVLLLEDLHDINEVRQLASKILSLVEEDYETSIDDIEMSASIGITLYPEDNVDSDGLIRHADQAMYEAKLLGKNRYHFFDVNAANAYQQLNKSISKVDKALRKNQFELYYQPKVNLSQNSIIGFEALIRWNHPEEGLILPNDFLPLIDGHMLSNELDNWVLNTAFRQLREFKNNNLDYVISINISPTTLLAKEFIASLKEHLDKYRDVDPSKLEIEVLETSTFSEIQIAQQHLQQIQELGIRVALDDFGTGASSLSYLKNLPANTIKIDQSFIFDILDDQSDLAIVEGIIQLSRVFHLEVIAEGVETSEHAKKLSDLGCNLIQGYWISKPIPASQLSDFIQLWTLPNQNDFIENSA